MRVTVTAKNEYIFNWFYSKYNSIIKSIRFTLSRAQGRFWFKALTKNILPLSLSNQHLLIYKSSLFSGGQGFSRLKTACCFAENRECRLFW